jgi:hypothetical protein
MLVCNTTNATRTNVSRFKYPTFISLLIYLLFPMSTFDVASLTNLLSMSPSSHAILLCSINIIITHAKKPGHLLCTGKTRGWNAWRLLEHVEATLLFNS